MNCQRWSSAWVTSCSRRCNWRSSVVMSWPYVLSLCTWVANSSATCRRLEREPDGTLALRLEYPGEPGEDHEEEERTNPPASRTAPCRRERAMAGSSTTMVRLAEWATRRRDWGRTVVVAGSVDIAAVLGRAGTVGRINAGPRTVEQDDNRTDAARAMGSQLFMGQSSSLPSMTLAHAREFREHLPDVPAAAPRLRVMGRDPPQLAVHPPIALSSSRSKACPYILHLTLSRPWGR